MSPFLSEDRITTSSVIALFAATKGSLIDDVTDVELQEEPNRTTLKKLLLSIADWIVDEIIRPAIESAVWLINWIKAELHYWTYEAVKWLTEFTKTTEGMLVTLAVVIGVAILAPQAIAALAESKIGLAIKKIVDWTKEKVGNILETIHFVDLLAIHQVLLVVWPTWGEIFTPFQDAISALAEQLGQGTGYIHAWLNVGHGLSLVGTSLLGIDPKIGEIRAMEKSMDFMKTIDEKFRNYAHDPGLLTRDIVETFYIPYAEEIRDTQGSTIASIKATREYTLTLNSSIHNLDSAFDNLISATLPEFREQMEENLSGMREVFDGFSEYIEGVILPKINLAFDVLSERADYLERANAIAAEKLAHPLDIYGAAEFLSEAEQANTWAYLLHKLGSAENDMYAAQMTPALETVDQGVNSALVPASRAPGMPSLGYEPAGIVPAAKTAEQRKHDWFVGEY